MKASPDAQLRLLELAGLDAELGRIAGRKRSLPEHAELDQLEHKDTELRDTLASLQAEEGDLKRAQVKAEADVDQVRTRVDRDRKRLEAGQVSNPRELENLQSEIVSLTRRQADLEEIVLDLMERTEAAQQGVAAATQGRAQIASQQQDAASRRDIAVSELDGQAGKAESERTAVSGDIPPDLMKLYEQLRVKNGVGAAALRRGRCEGCHLSLNTVDLNTIRAAPADEILRCEECRRILVRTPESGL